MLLTPEDYRAVARLHKAGIPQGFLSSLGEKFLANLYFAISRHPESCLIIERDAAGRTAGFVAGTLSTRRCYRYAMTRHALRLGFPVLLKLLSFKTLKRIFETLRYPGQQSQTHPSPEPELLAIAVDEALRGKGAGKKLVAGLEAFFKAKGLTEAYKVVTWAEDPRSNAFYKSAGFTFVREFVHHGNRMNEYQKSMIP